MKDVHLLAIDQGNSDVVFGIHHEGEWTYQWRTPTTNKNASHYEAIMRQRLLDANEFWSLGFEETYFLSSLTGSGSGDLLDAVVEHISDEEEEESNIPKFAIVGQPNVGKSSVSNALLKQNVRV